MSLPTLIHWFRQDLRLSDNPSFTHACMSGEVLPVYILDTQHAAAHAPGGASRWWLHHALRSLNDSLQGRLNLYAGDPQEILNALIKKYPIRAVCWNRCYEPWQIARDTRIKDNLKSQGIEAESFNGSLLWEPWETLKSDGTPYRVFTPFYRKGCLNAPSPRQPLPAPARPNCFHSGDSLPLESLGLLPRIRWDAQLEPHWEIGEAAAQQRLNDFLAHAMRHYKQGRNFPAQPHVSRLSPYLHFGHLSPNQAWHAARLQEMDANLDSFCSELGWREFSYHLLYHHPTLPHENLQAKFNAFPWRNDPGALERWQRGQTGYPLVDAGMRELWQTGYMHNRVRMVVGSFLVKNLLLDWRHGERWFWDCLVDADLASNSASWQWIAGCGADAAPYFRVFNPTTQAEKFDPDGAYTRRFVPELAGLDNRYLFRPWEAPPDMLRRAGITLGKTYPHPIVDAKLSRERALAAFASLRS